MVWLVDGGVVVVLGALEVGPPDAVEPAGSGAVGLEVEVLVLAGFELPQPASNSTSAAPIAGISARGLTDRRIAADIELEDEAHQ